MLDSNHRPCFSSRSWYLQESSPGSRPRSKRKVTAKSTACASGDSKKKTLLKDACDDLDNGQDSDCMVIKKPTKTGDEVRWSGIRIPSIQKLFQETIGESSNGRIRVKLHVNNHVSRVKPMLTDVFKCSSEIDLLALLKNSCNERITFEFYYKSEDYLYSCIVPDGLWSLRNFAALQKGILLKHTYIWH